MEGTMDNVGVIDCKAVMDMDGFWTEYTLYSDGDTYWCVFGDTDLYGPDAWHDWDGETLEEALEWFECYEGFEDDETGTW